MFYWQLQHFYCHLLALLSFSPVLKFILQENDHKQISKKVYLFVKLTRTPCLQQERTGRCEMVSPTPGETAGRSERARRAPVWTEVLLSRPELGRLFRWRMVDFEGNYLNSETRDDRP